MKISVLYAGSSLLAPLRYAEGEINRQHGLDLQVAPHNFGLTFDDEQWQAIERDILESEIVFVIHVMDGENASRLINLLDEIREQNRTVVVINCMPEVMKRTRMRKLRFAGSKSHSHKDGKSQSSQEANTLFSTIASWIGKQARRKGRTNGSRQHNHSQYLKFAERLPILLKFVPSTGAIRDVKNYLLLFSYFIQPTPLNIQSMLLHALKQYGSDERAKRIDVAPAETQPSVGIYHPDAMQLFSDFQSYDQWYKGRTADSNYALDPSRTIGLLLMRPQVISNTRRHYDQLIRSIEAEGLSVVPVISTLMDNREACEKFFLDNGNNHLERRSRISQIVSLTGFSFVGGPAMNDSEAATAYLRQMNIPYRSLVSLDTQTIESWRESLTGLNPVQTGMQVAIPEIDGATEPFVFGGIPEWGFEPVPLDERCARIARRFKRWNRLQTAERKDLKVALTLYCFPPNKGNLGTAADLDVFASIFDILQFLENDGYSVAMPESATALREMLLNCNTETVGTSAHVGYRMNVQEYRQLSPYVGEVEQEWGAAPGKVNASGNELFIQGVQLGNVFLGVQPTFGYEGDPMRMMMARSGAPHHGYVAFYCFIEKVFKADVVIHVGTHGATEFMPGKQVGLSANCWPDRLIGELPNVYIYSVNNPSEGAIAKRRSYAELISYLTPPLENAGLYRELATLKELIVSYRESNDEEQQQALYESIEALSRKLNLSCN